MANKKNNRRSKQGWFSKAVNVGLWGLAFSRVIEIIFSERTLESKFAAISNGATFGLSEGAFNLEAGLRMYTPGGAAAGLNELKKYAMRHFPVR